MLQEKEHMNTCEVRWPTATEVLEFCGTGSVRQKMGAAMLAGLAYR